MRNKPYLPAFIMMIFVLNCFAQITGSFTDSRDGKVYKTATIGKQTWMAENLAYKAKNGCWAYNNDEKNVALFGYLYTWETAKISCPKGWHLPNDKEWQQLIDYLGGYDSAGGKLKSATLWKGYDYGATNSLGFSALPGGYRHYERLFQEIGTGGYWWSASGFNDFVAWYWFIFGSGHGIYSTNGSIFNALSVRCVKD